MHSLWRATRAPPTSNSRAHRSRPPWSGRADRPNSRRDGGLLPPSRRRDTTGFTRYVSRVSTATAEQPIREELRRIAADTAYAFKLARGRVELPAATPADGPDPYGNPDPEWLRIDWREHRHQVDVVGADVNYVEMGE